MVDGGRNEAVGSSDRTWGDPHELVTQQGPAGQQQEKTTAGPRAA